VYRQQNQDTVSNIYEMTVSTHFGSMFLANRTLNVVKRLNLFSARHFRSDGAQPHIINIHFRRKVEVQEVAFHCNFKQDESYTPQKVVIRTGTTLHDLVVRLDDAR
jgi:hypothetical protein